MGDSSPITTRQAGADRINPGSTPLRLEAAVLDWAGTVVDFGSFAPTQIF
ncbi:MAG: phosphonoacetaldehyde hydrolase, partial [Pseudomonadota bacterium]